MEKKKDIVIVILMIIALVLAGVLLFTVLTKDNTKEEKTKTTENTTKEDLSGVETSLLNIIDNYKIDVLDIYGNDITVSTTPTNEQLNAMYYSVSQGGTSEVPSIPKSVVDNYFKTVYNTVPASYPDIMCKIDNKVLYTYDSNKGEYALFTSLPNAEELDHSHSGYLNETLAKTVKNIKKVNDTYVLDVAKLYQGSMVDVSGEHFYSDGTYKNQLKDFEQFFDQNTGEGNTEEAIKYFNSNKDKMKAGYRYTFKKVNDNYYITKYQVIK